MAACVALLAAISTIAGIGDRPAFLRFGGDPSQGVLVNLTPGMRPFDPPDPGRPTLVFIHGCNAAPKLVHFTMGERLAEAVGRRGGPGFSVLDWNWNAATVVGLKVSTNEAKAVEQGRRLAAALLRSGVPLARTHLIGHSSGSIVAASAARTLLSGHGQPVAQLTLLDPAVSYHGLVFDVLAAGSSARLVENYWAAGPSGYGRAIARGRLEHAGGRPDSLLRGPLTLHSNHFHVVEWYIATVADPRSPGGFNTEPARRPGVRDRVEMILLSDAGWSPPRIAIHLGCAARPFATCSGRFWRPRCVVPVSLGTRPEHRPPRPGGRGVETLARRGANLDQSATRPSPRRAGDHPRFPGRSAAT